MIVLKYTKNNNAAYFAHLDLMRTFMMAIRRTKLQVNYSTGFNPHMLLFFAPPLPVGANSVAEYLAVDSKEHPVKFMETLNLSLPDGIKILRANGANKNPNFAAISRAAIYDIILSKPVQLPDIKKVFDSDTLQIQFEQKGATVTKEVRDKIFWLAGEGSDYQFTLSAGNQNLRADRLMRHFLSQAGYGGEIAITTTKTNLLTNLPAISSLKLKLSLKELVDVDELFFK